MSYFLQFNMFIGTFAAIASIVCGYEIIRLLYSKKWATDNCIELLKAYSVYIIFCALNGMAESYAFAKCDSDTIA